MSKINILTTIKYVILILFIIICFFPFYYAVLNSFRYIRQIPDLGWLPTNITLDNWLYAFKQGSYVPRWIFNSIFVTTIISTLTLIFDTCAGYAFARKIFPGNKFLFMTVIFCYTVPYAMLLIPIYTMMSQLKLLNTYIALIAPAASPLGVFMIRQSVFSVPKDLDEAAKLDGCSDFGIFWRIVLPLLKPALASVFIVTFVTQWNWFIYPFIVTNKEEMFTLTVGLYNVAQTSAGALWPPEWGLIMVLITVTFIPLFFVFLIFQEYFTRGMVLSGMK